MRAALCCEFDPARLEFPVADRTFDPVLFLPAFGYARDPDADVADRRWTNQILGRLIAAQREGVIDAVLDLPFHGPACSGDQVRYFRR